MVTNMINHIDKVNLAMIAATASAVIWMFSTFASASDMAALRTDIWYEQYYQTRDRIFDATDPDYLRELQDRLEKLKAQICEEDPEWRPCHIDEENDNEETVE